MEGKLMGHNIQVNSTPWRNFPSPPIPRNEYFGRPWRKIHVDHFAGSSRSATSDGGSGSARRQDGGGVDGDAHRCQEQGIPNVSQNGLDQRSSSRRQCRSQLGRSHRTCESFSHLFSLNMLRIHQHHSLDIHTSGLVILMENHVIHHEARKMGILSFRIPISLTEK